MSYQHDAVKMALSANQRAVGRDYQPIWKIAFWKEVMLVTALNPVLIESILFA